MNGEISNGVLAERIGAVASRLDGHIEAFNDERRDAANRRREMHEKIEAVEKKIDGRMVWIVKLLLTIAASAILTLLSALGGLLALLAESEGWI